ncbi:MAG: acyl--CoA ligase [Mycobacterium sp.]|nr:acyl--CoA ligase [Mycobacterium sp.]
MSNADMLISDILTAGRSRHPDKPAIVGDALVRTYDELDDRVGRLAGALAAAGVEPHDRVALLAANHPGVIEIHLATAMIGAVVVPLNPRVTAGDIAFQADDAGVGFAFAQPELESLARAGGLFDRVAWLLGGQADDLIASAGRYRGVRPAVGEVTVQLYTSGTTGRPKGCLLTHRAWLSSVSGIAHAIALSDNDVVWPQLPLFHVAGLHFLFATLATGGTYVLDGPRDPAGFWEIVRARSVSIVTLFPTPRPLIEHPDATGSLGSVRLAFAQHVDEALVQELPHVTPATSYGATELGGMAVLALGDDCLRPGAVLGRPLLGMTAAVLDDADEPVPTGAVGEICIRGAATATGYWNLPEASAELMRSGWLHTGDLGRQDPDGLLFFIDRKKDMVKSGGENVYSTEVESVLTEHPSVSECAVIGVPDDRWGEAVKAVVVASDATTAAELDSWCLERLAAFKRPRWYEFVAALPRNATAKVIKPELRAAHDAATAIRLSERD